MTDSITTVTFFKMSGFKNKLYGFTQVQTALKKMEEVPGLSFLKTLGTGGGDGFSLRPDFSTYAFLMVWENRAHADAFYAKNNFYLHYKQRSEESFTLYLKNAMAHGRWSGQNPFKSAAKVHPDKPVVVLTRARIKTEKLITFWTNVGSAADDLHRYNDLLFGVGVGELPAIQQATISFWKTAAAMSDFAYSSKHHKKVIQLTRKNNWYKEELFARFVPFDVSGSWNNKPFDKYLARL